jgi:hypothetical protein
VDDEEAGDVGTPSKKRKLSVAKEETDENGDVKEIDGFGGFQGQTATQFKMESLSSGEEFVDLEDEK